MSSLIHSSASVNLYSAQESFIIWLHSFQPFDSWSCFFVNTPFWPNSFFIFFLHIHWGCFCVTAGHQSSEFCDAVLQTLVHSPGPHRLPAALLEQVANCCRQEALEFKSHQRSRLCLSEARHLHLAGHQLT